MKTDLTIGVVKRSYLASDFVRDREEGRRGLEERERERVKAEKVKKLLKEANKAKKADEAKKGAEDEKRKSFASDWDELREHLRVEALDKGAPAAIKTAYKDILKIDAQMRRSGGLSADELAKRNLDAEQQLIKEGYLDE